MTMSVDGVNSVSGVSYTGRDNDNEVRVTEVGVVGGATVSGAKYGLSSLKKFSKASVTDVIDLSRKTTAGVKQATQAGQQVQSLWSRIGVNAKEFSQAIVKWAEKSATGKLASRVVKSKAFGKASAAVGGIGAVFVFISGIGEMGNTFSKMAQKPEYFEA